MVELPRRCSLSRMTAGSEQLTRESLQCQTSSSPCTHEPLMSPGKALRGRPDAPWVENTRACSHGGLSVSEWRGDSSLRWSLGVGSCVHGERPQVLVAMQVP